VLALRFDLLPASLRPRTVAWLAGDIAAHNGHLTTGFLGSSFVLPVLSDGDRDDVAFELLLTRTFPSWLYEVDHGATTIWERWNGDHGDPGMNSYSHYAFGSVGEWLYRYLAGIDQTSGSVALDTVRIAPRWTSSLDSVRATYRSPHGTIVSAWHRTAGGTIVVDVTIPANARGVVILPAASGRISGAPGTAVVTAAAAERSSYSLGAGTYRFVVRPR